jgi:cbb3-type cytochrome oxidase subunit 3
MDVNTLRIVVTVAAMAAFLAIAVWSYLPSRRAALEVQARSILEESDP